MTSSLLPFILCTAIAAQAALADDLLPAPPSPSQPPAQMPTQPAPAQPPSKEAVEAARAACEADVQKLCNGVQPGGGRILACLKQHKDEVSVGCKQAVQKATKGSN
jgi:hypothetical protein